MPNPISPPSAHTPLHTPLHLPVTEPQTARPGDSALAPSRPDPVSRSGGVSFAETLFRGLERLADGEERMQRAIRRATRPGGATPEVLLALQAGVYRHTQEVELASKLVDKATGALRQTLQSQQ